MKKHIAYVFFALICTVALVFSACGGGNTGSTGSGGSQAKTESGNNAENRSSADKAGERNTNGQNGNKGPEENTANNSGTDGASGSQAGENNGGAGASGAEEGIHTDREGYDAAAGSVDGISPRESGSEPDRSAAMDGIDLEIYRQWKEIIEKSDDPLSPAKAIALMKSMGETLPDSILWDFLDYHNRLCYSMEPEDIAGSIGVIGPETAAAAIGLTYKEYQENCYGFWTSEGYIMYTTDMGALGKALSGRISRASADYLLLAHEYPVTDLVNDAGLIKPWDEVARYMVSYYDYVTAWPEGMFTDDAISSFDWTYRLYVGAIRLDNTPFDEGGSLVPALRQSYEDLLKSLDTAHPLAEDIRLLSSMWASKGYRMDNEIRALIYQLTEQHPFM